ncbi:MAG: formate--tetrahydrofolate ligase [Armatimonadota bacterium]|nr:formate--tetrahydrofolate ligase [Armatimonadota bacterium]MDR7485482.1 formate--tetrahydrofolate ligase [Armatimonadota bacterium]MDR7533027.1 formate--tetrahydrofolate ligase [Armatimonadota bacterium]MDR7536801.1 formate--tetrahydrofolate ligase [Armatimonadota bacterium]
MSTTLPRVLRPIAEVAAEAGLEPAEIVPYGLHAAKVRLEALARRTSRPGGHVVLVTAITPTPPGEGKTVTAIGLAQGLRRLGARTVLCLRQPSLGPVFGMKGGATGGGRCTVEPAVAINLHFTGDFHAVTAANNLLAAMLDDHLHRRRDPLLDPRQVTHRRVLDVNDRALRHAVVGLGGVVREEHFDITAASEVMAVLALAADYADLRRRLGRIIVGTTRDGTPVTADDLRAAGAMAVLLRDALQPNLVQTQEGGPALVHAGPFGNIAHGTSSLLSLRLARALAEFAVVEAGFGADLGAEKFANVVGACGGPQPAAAVVVVTVRALRHHGGAAADRLSVPDLEAVTAGLPQLRHHVQIVQRLGMRPVVCVNRFASDTAGEIDAILAAARAQGVPAAVCDAYHTGGAGAEDLARLVQEAAARGPLPEGGRLYGPDTPLRAKVEAVARQIYGAAGVAFAETAARQLEDAERRGFGRLPVCIAKTQYSLTDRPHIRGVPEGFTLPVREVAVRGGAGFVLVLVGDVMTMPALPARPRAWEIDLDGDGTVRGLD